MTQTNSADAFNWKRLKQSNPSALGYFYDRYADKLFAAALHMSKDRDVAKDAVQETFISLWSYRNTLGDIRHYQGYQVKVMRYLLVKQLSVGKEIGKEELTKTMYITEKTART